MYFQYKGTDKYFVKSAFFISSCGFIHRHFCIFGAELLCERLDHYIWLCLHCVATYLISQANNVVSFERRRPIFHFPYWHSHSHLTAATSSRHEISQCFAYTEVSSIKSSKWPNGMSGICLLVTRYQAMGNRQAMAWILPQHGMGRNDLPATLFIV